MNLDWIFKNIESAIHSDIDTFSDSIIYLDSEQLSELYSSLSGMKGRPSVEAQKISGEIKASLILGAGVSSDVSNTVEISDIHLLKAILPALRNRYVTLSDCALFKQKIKQRVWLKGKISYESNNYLDTSNFNFDNLKSFKPVFKTRTGTKFTFAEIDCSLPLLENYLSSIYRSLFLHKKGFEDDVELLGYIHEYNEIPIGTAEKPSTWHKSVIAPIFIFKFNG